jgi:flagellin
MNAHTNGLANNRELSSSLEKLSSGLRINKAADDSSGMAIADSLRSQASTLGQAINNANDAIGIIQIADKAMDEQLKILDKIKVKATQAAQDGQTSDSRMAIQKDIRRLMEQLDNIAKTTTFNGQSLLNGSFTNKEFQVGAYSNQTINATIGATESQKIGHVRLETSEISAAGTGVIKFSVAGETVTLESVTISTSAGTGVGALASVINKNSDLVGVKASWSNQIAIKLDSAGDVTSLAINGINIGNISGVKTNDNDGRLVAAINAVKERTGVEASTDEKGNLILRSMDGRGINISKAGGLISPQESYGQITLTRLDARDIVATGIGISEADSVANVNLKDVIGKFDADVRSAAGANVTTMTNGEDLKTGVQTLKGAMLVMDIAESATKALDEIRADLGSVQNQLVSTINNITVTQVNVKAAESNIRDVDFASESSTFQKHNILAQSGSYAMSQANAVQQNVMRLLQ